MRDAMADWFTATRRLGRAARDGVVEAAFTAAGWLVLLACVIWATTLSHTLRRD